MPPSWIRRGGDAAQEGSVNKAKPICFSFFFELCLLLPVVRHVAQTTRRWLLSIWCVACRCIGDPKIFTCMMCVLSRPHEKVRRIVVFCRRVVFAFDKTIVRPCVLVLTGPTRPQRLMVFVRDRSCRNAFVFERDIWRILGLTLKCAREKHRWR